MYWVKWQNIFNHCFYTLNTILMHLKQSCSKSSMTARVWVAADFVMHLRICTFLIASDEKLGGRWERGQQAHISPLDALFVRHTWQMYICNQEILSWSWLHHAPENTYQAVPASILQWWKLGGGWEQGQHMYVHYLHLQPVSLYSQLQLVQHLSEPDTPGGRQALSRITIN